MLSLVYYQIESFTQKHGHEFRSKQFMSDKNDYKKTKRRKKQPVSKIEPNVRNVCTAKAITEA